MYCYKYSTAGTFNVSATILKAVMATCTTKITVLPSVTPSVISGNITSATGDDNSDHCGTFSGATLTHFNWTYQGANPYAGYQIQVANDSNFPSGSILVDSGEVGTASNTYPVWVSASPLAGQLAYANIYFWRVRVWDNANPRHDSGWYYSGQSKTVGQYNFQTPDHPWPFASFTPKTQTGHLVNNVYKASLINGSICYDDAQNECTYSWNFGDGETRVDTWRINAYKNYEVASKTPYPVTLKVCNVDGNCCSMAGSVTVSPGSTVPEWKEISPF